MIRVVSAGIFPKISQSVRQLKWDRQWSAVANFPSLLGFWLISNPFLAKVSALRATCCPSCEPTRRWRNQSRACWHPPTEMQRGIETGCGMSSSRCLLLAWRDLWGPNLRNNQFLRHLSTAQRIALLHNILEDTWSFWSCEVVKHKWNKRMDQFWEGMFYSWGCELLDLDLTWKDHAGQTKTRAIDHFWALRGDNICLKCSILWRNEDSLIDQARKKTSRVTTSN